MNEPAITPDAITTRRHFDSQRLAWGVLLLSFAIFGLMCVTAGLGLNYFLFQSVVPLEAVVRVGRGSSGVNGQFVSTAKDLTYNDELVTAAQSQAVIFFRDPNRGNRLVATVTLKGNTELAYRRALRPRFEWSANSYTIELEEYVGDLIVFIVPDLQRDVLLSIRSREGSRAYFNSPGRYLVNASSEEMHVVNLNGDVALIASDGQTTRHLPAGSQGAILDASQQIDLSEGYLNLLDNQDANAGGSPGPAATNVLNEDLLLSWACTNSQDELPRGDYVSELEDGRPVLRLLRAGNATKNGETRCVARSINDSNGQNVSSYDYLALQLTFKINYQSLNICGQAGSECPLTVRIDYLDTEGRGQRWFHGFYYYVDPQRQYPLRCDSCALEHEQVVEKAWYTYDTGNIFALVGPNAQPEVIVAVYIYASGHQYDVTIGEVSLLAGRLQDEADENVSPGASG